MIEKLGIINDIIVITKEQISSRNQQLPKYHDPISLLKLDEN